MPLILAIEPDRRQASQLKRLTRGCAADLVLADTTTRALEVIGNRIPDLVLVPALLSPQDDAALATALRVIAAAAHVQTLTIPVFAAPVAAARVGVLAKWRRGRAKPASQGCDPVVFAEQIAAYLAEAAAAREALTPAAEETAEKPVPVPAVQPAEPATPPPAESEEEWEPVELEEPRPLEASAPAVVDPASVPEPLSEPVAQTAQTELWAALSLASHRWPRLDAMLANPHAVTLAPDAAPGQPQTIAAAPSRPESARPEPARPEWLDMVDALRRDIDRLRVQRTEAARPAPIDRAHLVAQARPVAPVAPVAPIATGPVAPPRRQKQKKDPVPIQDEWGFFDPQQCGFTALLAKLDEISNSSQ